MNSRSIYLSIFVLFSAAGFLTYSPTVHAQGAPSSVAGIELTLSTQNPSPGQSLKISGKSYSIDLFSANITWTIDGRVVEKGIGLTEISFKAPPLGKKMTISVTATDTNGATLKNSFILITSTVDMVMEPEGYVPENFQGKISPIHQNKVKVTAIPHVIITAGTEADPKTLVYKWEQDDRVLESQSGYGRQSVTLQGGIVPRPYNLKVTITSRDGIQQAMSSMTVTPESPFILFYKNDPLYGPLYNTALSESIYLGAQRETGVLAVPYGFDMPQVGIGDLVLTWFINGLERPELSSNQSLTLRAPQGSSGSSDISLEISHKERILQSSKGSLRAVFSESSNN